MSISDALQRADLVVIGSGFFGATIAQCAAEQLGARVVVLEKRNHIGGNAYSYPDPDTGIEVHKYGSHIFHTSNRRVWDYANRFTSFNDYRHHVWTQHSGRTFPMPIGLATLGAFLGKTVSPQEARQYIAEHQVDNGESEPANFEEQAIRLIGRELYEAFIKGYTRKQWDIDPRQLPAEVIRRLPVRYTYNTRYFNDTWEGIPSDGYGEWLRRMLSAPGIEVFERTDFFDLRQLIPTSALLVYTGPLDQYFDFRFGKLTWRSLDLEIEIRDESDFQGTSVMNYADMDVSFTRIHEFKHFQPERFAKTEQTVIMKEFSRMATESHDPYYPVNSTSDRAMLVEYREAARSDERVIFGGRLGSYQYLDMHMAIASALSVFENEVVTKLRVRT